MHSPQTSSSVIAEEVLVSEYHLAFTGGLRLAPFNVGADIFRFALGDAAVDGDVKLGTGLIAVDALLLEVHIDTEVIEQADILQAVHRVPREPGNGFRDDHVDFPLFAAADHAVEFISVFHTCAGDALIGVDTFKRPSVFGIDAFGIVLHLIFITVELFLLLSGNAAVCRHPQDSAMGFHAFSDRYGRFDYPHHSLRGDRCLLHRCAPFV